MKLRIHNLRKCWVLLAGFFLLVLCSTAVSAQTEDRQLVEAGYIFEYPTESGKDVLIQV